ncbi:SxtP, partial [Rhodopirellula maiorica SM1]
FDLSVSPFTVSPGEQTQTQLSATDADGDNLTFSILAHQSLPKVTVSPQGLLTFSPTPDDVGQYQITASVSDGTASDTIEFTVTVPDHVPGAPTQLSGRILDTNSTPLVGVPIELGSTTTTTNDQGEFTLDTAVNFDGDALIVRGEAITGPNVYPYIAEKLPLVLDHPIYEGFSNVIPRPIFLPALDVAGGSTIIPGVENIVEQEIAPGEMASVTVAANTLTRPDGSPYDGVLSITEVPPDLTPAALPDNLLTDVVVTIQPGEMQFAVPAPLRLPNRAGLAPGTPTDLWSINPVTGEFEDVGDGIVSNDGTAIETISGGIRNSSWHFAAPPVIPPTQALPQNGLTANQDDNCPQQCDPNCDCVATTGSIPTGGKKTETNSDVELHSGALIETHQTVTYQSQGVTRGIKLVYDSQRADPRPIVHFGYTDLRPDANSRLVADITFSDGVVEIRSEGVRAGEFGLTGGQRFWKLPDDIQDGQVAIQTDLRSLASGIYGYELNRGTLTLTNDNRFVGETATTTGEVVHINSIDSPYGAGWGISGLDQIVSINDGSVLIINGDGTQARFLASSQQGDPFVSPGGDFTRLTRLIDGSYQRVSPNQFTETYDTDGRIMSRTDRNGNQTTYTYVNGIISEIVDPVGKVTTFGTENGKIISITDPAGRITQLEYSGKDLSRVIDPDGSSRTFVYDSGHRMIEETNKRGFTERTQYGFHGRVTSATRTDGTKVFVEPLQTKNLLPLAVQLDPETAPVVPVTPSDTARLLDANANITSVTLDQTGRAINANDGEGNSSEFVRDADNQITLATDARGNQSRFTYDDRGNLISQSDTFYRGVRIPSETHDITSPDGTFAFVAVLASGDFNNDALEDIVAAGELFGSSENLIVMPSQSHEGFSDMGIALNVPSTHALEVADLNADGRLDIIGLSIDLFTGNKVSVSLGIDGSAFTTLPLLDLTGLQVDERSKLRAGEFTSDGTIDLIVGTSDGQLAVFPGVGDGTFLAPIVTEAAEDAEQFELADFNDDGDLDVAVVPFSTPNFNPAQNEPTEVSIMLGRGDGTFNDPRIVLTGNDARDIAIADMNGDGFEDLVTANLSNSISVVFGEVGGNFGTPQDFDTGVPMTEVLASDLNSDGDVDLVGRIDDNGLRDTILVFENDGNGGITLFSSLPASSVSQATTIADFNGDGVPELATGASEGFVGASGGQAKVAVYTSDGEGGFLTSDRTPLGLEPQLIRSADLDGDENLDVLVLDSVAETLVAFYGDGTGAFLPTPISDAVGGQGFSQIDLDLSDLNGDGKVDISVANFFGEQIELFISNIQPRSYTRSTVSLGTQPILVRTADFNRDEVNDLFVVDNSNLQVFAGDGSGGFELLTAMTHDFGGNITEVLTGDINNDGLVDVVIDGFAQLGNGNGTFQEPLFVQASRNSALGDIDGDGILDLVFASAVNSVVALKRGNGDGTFQTAESIGSGGADRLFDMDGDGNLDAVGYFGDSIIVSRLASDGSVVGRDSFVIGARVSGIQNPANNYAIGDFNNDGIGDVASATDGFDLFG